MATATRLFANTLKSTLQPVAQSFDDVAAQEEAGNLVKACLDAIPSVNTACQVVHICLRVGMERKKLEFILKETKDALAFADEIFTRVKQKAEGQEFEEREDGIAELEQTLTLMRATSARVDEILTWLKAPPPQSFRLPVETDVPGPEIARQPQPGYVDLESVRKSL